MDLMKLAQIPYKEKGRTVEGCDCYGFVRLVLEQAGWVLPEYSFQNCGGEKEGGCKAFKAQEVETPQNYDVIYMVSNKDREHIGVFVDGRVWHMTRDGVLSRPWFRAIGQIKGVFRIER